MRHFLISSSRPENIFLESNSLCSTAANEDFSFWTFSKQHAGKFGESLERSKTGIPRTQKRSPSTEESENVSLEEKMGDFRVLARIGSFY